MPHDLYFLVPLLLGFGPVWALPSPCCACCFWFLVLPSKLASAVRGPTSPLATYWFRPILSELIGAAETATINRSRAPSGPIKVTVTIQPLERPHGDVNLITSVIPGEFGQQNCALPSDLPALSF